MSSRTDGLSDDSTVGGPPPPNFVLMGHGPMEGVQEGAQQQAVPQEPDEGQLIPLNQVARAVGLQDRMPPPPPAWEGFTFRLEHGLDSPLRNLLAELVRRTGAPSDQLPA